MDKNRAVLEMSTLASRATGMLPFLRGPAPDHRRKGASCARELGDAPPVDLAAHAQWAADACRVWAIIHRSRVIVPEGPDDIVIGRRAVAFFVAESDRLRAASVTVVDLPCVGENR
jgi:hypothetical protein